MNIVGQALKVTIYLSEGDRHHNQALYMAILQLLKKEGAAGATVTRGVAGFGAHTRIHTANVVSLTDALPLIIEWVDKPDRVNRILPKINQMVTEGLVAVQPINVTHYSHRALKQLSDNTLVREAMTYEVASIVAGASVNQVVDLLIEKGYRVLPVVDKAWHVLGVISEGDLLRAGLSFIELESGGAPDADTRRAVDLMTAPPITIFTNDTLARAIDLMVKHGVKRLPALDEDGTLAGLLSRADVLRLFSEAALVRNAPPEFPAGQLRVGQIMLTDVPEVIAGTPVSEVVEQLLRIRSRRVVVVDAQQHVLGVITDGDLLERVTLAERKSVFDTLFRRNKKLVVNDALTADAVMTRPAVSVQKDMSLEDALQLLVEHQIKRLPVVDSDGKLVGMVGRGGILRALHAHPDV